MVVVVMFGMLLAGALVQSSIVLFGLSQIILPQNCLRLCHQEAC